MSTTVARAAAQYWLRDHVLENVSASGDNEPSKAEGRTALARIMDAIDALEALAAAGVSWTQGTIRVRSTANVTIASGLENGDTLNGVTLATGDHVFLAYQTAPAENGIYTVVASGAASRATFADSAAELARIGFYIAEGTDGAGEQWTLALDAADITLGTTALNFSRLSPAPGYAAEVITARGSEASLDARITAVDAKVRIGSTRLFVGALAGASRTTGNYLTFVGEESGADTTSGGENTAIGFQSLCNVTTGAQNFAGGSYAGAGLTGAASRNTAIGAESMTGLDQFATVTNSIAIGYGAQTRANHQAVIGTPETLELVVHGNLRYGHGGPMISRNSVANETWLLAGAGPSDKEAAGTGNVALGTNAGQALTADGTASVYVGKDAGRNVQGGIDHTFVGAGAGEAQIDGVGCVAVGRLSGKTSTTAEGWTAVGDTALEFNNADNVVGVGYGAGRDQSTGVGGVYLGAYAGGYSAAANHTTVVGTEALGGSNYGHDNTIGGWRAGHVMTGERNTGWGSEAQRSNTTGSDNTAVGFRAGFQISTGTNNTFVGRSAGHDASQKVDAVNSMALGALTFTTKSNQVVIGNSSVTEFVLGGVTITTAQLTALLALL